MQDYTVKQALLSVADKTGLQELADGLIRHRIKVLSTGGTCEQLRAVGVSVQEVSDYTGFPEIIDGRVKTLHPKIHGGLLGRRTPDGMGADAQVMAAHKIYAIDLLVVNLYPFEKTIARANCSLDEAIKNIDIGGPAMLRSAAKNFQRVAVVVDVADYASVIKELDAHAGRLSYKTRFKLAIKAFAHVTQYDAAISNYLGAVNPADDSLAQFPHTITTQYVKKQRMRYGENPHQAAAFYVSNNAANGSIATAVQLQGKALSYNNVADADAALACVGAFSAPACVIIKHANPCGVALASRLLKAYTLAWATDPRSAFGGIIAFNRSVSRDLAAAIVARQFVEVVIAPDIDAGALAEFARKKNVRVLQCGSLHLDQRGAQFHQQVSGGLLVQDADLHLLDDSALRVVTERGPSKAEKRDLLFAWSVAKYAKSNAVVYAKDNQTIGIGAGQTARVYSAIVAGIKAADENLAVKGSVMASDAFFPFRDGIDAAAKAGITAVIQPGGSMRDKEVIQAANEADMAMLFTGMRHFRH